MGGGLRHGRDSKKKLTAWRSDSWGIFGGAALAVFASEGGCRPGARPGPRHDATLATTDAAARPRAPLGPTTIDSCANHRHWVIIIVIIIVVVTTLIIISTHHKEVQSMIWCLWSFLHIGCLRTGVLDWHSTCGSGDKEEEKEEEEEDEKKKKKEKRWRKKKKEGMKEWRSSQPGSGCNAAISAFDAASGPLGPLCEASVDGWGGGWWWLVVASGGW